MTLDPTPWHTEEDQALCPNCGSRLPPLISIGLCPSCFLEDLDRGQGLESNLPDSFAEDLLRQGFPEAQFIGKGGMGWVFKAIQEPLRRPIAIKVLMPGLSLDRIYIHKFLLEARSAANLKHPHILPVYEVGEWNGSPYYVSKWMPKGSLADWMKYRPNTVLQSTRSLAPFHDTSNPNPIDSCLKWIIQISEAVECAHQSGIIHRDLKPSNILLDEALNAYVADFGLAEMVQDDGSMVSSKFFAGTPQYMAPELVETNRATVRSDVYALGMILYELLTGSCPFNKEISFQLLRTIVEKHLPSPRELNPGIPGPLSVICMKCLEKDPVNRYESAQGLVDDLNRFRNGYPVKAAPSSSFNNLKYWSKRNPQLAVLSGTFLLVLVVFILSLSFANKKLSAKEARLATEASHSKLLIADRYLEEVNNKPTEALLQLVEAIKLDRGNHLASYRLIAELMHRPLPDLGDEVFRHPSAVSDIALNAETGSLVSAGYDSQIRIWDVANPVQPQRTWANTNIINDISVDPLRNLMAMVGTTTRPEVFDTRDFSPILPWQGFPMLTYATELHPSGKWVVSGAYDGNIRVWNLSSGMVEQSISLESPVYCMAFDHDGKHFAAGTKAGKTRVWNWPIESEAMPPIHELEHPKEVSSILFVDGDYKNHPNFIVTGSHDGYVRGWDKKSGLLKWITRQNMGAPVSSVIHISSEKKPARIVAGGSNGRIFSIWTLLGDPVSIPMTLPSGVMSLDYDANRNRVYAALKNGDVVSWVAGEETLISPQSGCGAIPIIFSLSPEGDFLVFGTIHNEIYTIQAGPLKEPMQPTAAKGNLTSACFLDGGGQVLLGFHDNRAEIWNTDAMNTTPAWVIKHEGVVMGVRASKSGEYFASYDYSGIVKVYNAKQPQKPLRVLKHPTGVNGIAFLESKGACLTVSNDNYVRYWSLNSSDQDPIPLFEHNDHVKGIDICSSEDWAVTGSSDYTAVIHDLRDGIGSIQSTSLQAGAKIDKIKITSNGRFIAAATGNPLDYGDFSLIIWDRYANPPTRKIIPFNGYIKDLTFDSPQLSVATSDWSGLARVWDLESGLPLTPPFRDDIGINQVAFSPDNTVLYTASNNATLKEWPLPPGRNMEIPKWFLDYVKDHIMNNFSLLGPEVKPEDYIPSNLSHDDYYVQLATWMKHRKDNRVFKFQNTNSVKKIK